MAESNFVSPEQLAWELRAINSRRDRNQRTNVAWRKADGNCGLAGSEPVERGIYDTTGLCLSGGGIRSAAMCLGAVQALHVFDRLEQVDYLSTVSGGGYLGCSLVANLSEASVVRFNRATPRDGQDPDPFPFAHHHTDTKDLQDAPAVQYIRDHTNYLMPAGFPDLLASIGVIVRGLVASAALVLGPILFLAGLTALIANSDRAITQWINAHVSWDVLRDFSLKAFFMTGFSFKLTTAAAIALVIYLFVLALSRSSKEANGIGAYEFRSDATRSLAMMLIVVAALVIDIQPQALAYLRNPDSGQGERAFAWFLTISKALAPFAGVMAIVAGWLANIAKADDQRRSMTAKVRAMLARGLLLVTAVVLPLLLWQLYLLLASAGILRNGSLSFAYGWLTDLKGDLAVVMMVSGVIVVLMSWGFEPNANSLHALYRDRLGDAFIFVPDPEKPGSVYSVDRLKLSALDTSRTPYPLINAALNIQRSEFANKRGRDADFFTFTPDFIGSRATGYAPTKVMESRIPTLDIATAMAVSGAAASSNMGASFLKPMAFTLALLNIRLGYWMDNPAFVTAPVGRAGDAKARADKDKASGPVRRAIGSIFGDAYLAREMFSTLNENYQQIYLTDGGHIENLGLYELLRRRCQLIIVIDAEADPGLQFSSLMAAQRYARLDLGIRINLPWQEIRERYMAYDLECQEGIRSGAVHRGSHGCHAAVGTIDYPDAPDGTIIYFKSTLTGDENDIVLNYKRKYREFPHETTADQFFGEEQFEAYRSLGFHAVKQFLEGDDHASGLDANRRHGKAARLNAVAALFDFAAQFPVPPEPAAPQVEVDVRPSGPPAAPST